MKQVGRVEIPQEAFTTTGTVIVTVDDGESGTDEETLTWTVETNSDPTLDVVVDQVSDEGDVVLLAVVGSDPDDDVLAFGASGLPDGLSIDPVTGEISGTITQTAAVAGPYAVTVTVDDGRGGTASVGFTWVVNAVNVDPVLDPIGDQVSDEGQTISLFVTASDVDGDVLRYAATGLPDGLSIDPVTGEIAGDIAVDAAAGSPYSVTVTVDDPTTGTDEQSFTWTVDEPSQRVTSNMVALYRLPCSHMLRLTIRNMWIMYLDL